MDLRRPIKNGSEITLYTDMSKNGCVSGIPLSILLVKELIVWFMKPSIMIH